MVLLFICYALMATQPIMDHCRRDGRFLVRFFTLEGRFPFYLITRAVSMPHIGIFLNFKHLSVHTLTWVRKYFREALQVKG